MSVDWRIVTYQVVGFSEPEQRFVALWRDAQGELHFEPRAVGPSPEYVQRKLEPKLYAEAAKARVTRPAAKNDPLTGRRMQARAKAAQG